MEFFLLGGVVVGALGAVVVTFVMFVAGMGKQTKSGRAFVERAERRRLEKEWAREDFEAEKARREGR